MLHIWKVTWDSREGSVGGTDFPLCSSSWRSVAWTPPTNSTATNVPLPSETHYWHFMEEENTTLLVWTDPISRRSRKLLTAHVFFRGGGHMGAEWHVEEGMEQCYGIPMMAAWCGFAILQLPLYIFPSHFLTVSESDTTQLDLGRLHAILERTQKRVSETQVLILPSWTVVCHPEAGYYCYF